MVSGAQEGINRLFYSAHEPTGDKGFWQHWEKGQSSGLAGQCCGCVSAHHLPPFWKGQAGNEEMCAQEGGKQHLTMMTTVLISFSTGGNYSSLRKPKSTKNELKKLRIKGIFAKGLADYNYLSK